MFTARYGLSPYINGSVILFKGFNKNTIPGVNENNSPFGLPAETETSTKEIVGNFPGSSTKKGI